MPQYVNNVALLSGAIATGAGSATNGISGVKQFHASGTTSSGTGAVSVRVEGTINGASWDRIGDISLTLGTTATSDGFVSDDRYTQIRGNVTSISGTGASVSLSMGY